MQTWLVTGGAGFIGSNFVLTSRAGGMARIVNLDALTYAGNLMNLAGLADDPDHVFVHGDVTDRPLVRRLLTEYQPRAIVHFAAESHVDRSIHGPDVFVRTNVLGTFNLLDEARQFWEALPAAEAEAFRFLQVSTDEVYGSLDPDEPAFTEATSYDPSSPYSASKAAADHMARAYHHTYGLPVLVTNCSNNYGPYQFPEKLIPLMILNGLQGKPLPIYGDGRNVRDWLYVEDHVEALRTVLERGIPGETYNIGGHCEKTNVEVVKAICHDLDEARPAARHVPHESLVTFVKDRKGHDRRYAIDTRKIETHLGWRPRETFESGLAKTVRWYLEHSAWVAAVQNGAYQEWIRAHYKDSAQAPAAS